MRRAGGPQTRNVMYYVEHRKGNGVWTSYGRVKSKRPPLVRERVDVIGYSINAQIRRNRVE